MTITKGIRELTKEDELPAVIRIRRKGAGRRSLISAKPDLPVMLEDLIEPSIRVDLESPLRWTCKSTRMLAKGLTRQGCRISHEKVAQLLRFTGYSLQGNRKTEEGGVTILIVISSFGTSTKKYAGRWPAGTLLFQSIPRKRS